MRKFLLFAFVVTMFAACVTDETTDVAINLSDDKIYAQFEEPESRVQMNEKMQMVWTEKDLLYVYGPNTRNRYRFNGKTGDTEGSFTKVNTYTPLDYEFDKYYAISPSSGGCGILTNGRFRLYSKTPGTNTQTYIPNSSDPSANLIFGTSEDGTHFKFINCLGYLRVSLTGNKSVKNVELINNSGGTIAGLCMVYIDKPEQTGVRSNASASILLDCGEGVQLTDTPTHFFFAVIPTTLENGITLKVTFTDGTIFPQSTSNEIDIQRNTITPMAVIETSDVSYQTVKVAYKGSHIVSPLLSGATSLSGYIDWGDGNTSLLNLVTSYDYTDNKEAHTINIKARNAQKIKFSGIDGIEEIDLSKF
jgi:hypothetical protein